MRYVVNTINNALEVVFSEYKLRVHTSDTEYVKRVLEGLPTDYDRATWLTTNYDCEQL